MKLSKEKNNFVFIHHSYGHYFVREVVSNLVYKQLRHETIEPIGQNVHGWVK